METRDRIIDLARTQNGKRPVGPDCDDLFGRFGMDGDDAREVVDAYVAEFDVRMDGFLWYFNHLGEPPIYRRILPVDLAGRPLPMIPVSVTDLVRIAEGRVWDIDYPTLTIRNRHRLWLWMTLGAFALGGVALLVS
ncbi:MAG: hypothetical protein AAF366_08515 [Pseudomonadota bacterium]